MKTKNGKKVLNGVLAMAMAAMLIPGNVYAEDGAENNVSSAGIPYTVSGEYDVQVPHVIVNQIYGGKDDGAGDHSFIELYNQSTETVDLSGWYLGYKSSKGGAQNEEWAYLELSGTIEGNGYYLVRCQATSGDSYAVPRGNQEWEMMLHNKGISVVLLSKKTELDDTFAGMVTEENRPNGYVDLLAVQGNDTESQEDIDAEQPPVFEGNVLAEQSKKKAVRRVDFQDTDQNDADTEILDYSKSEGIEADKLPHGTSVEGGEDDGTSEEPVLVYRNNSFEADVQLNLERTGSLSIGTANPDGGVAEIVAYNKENEKAYIVNGQEGVLEAAKLNADGTLEESQVIQVKNLIDDFTYGDMTSVAVDTVYDRIAIALQADDYRAQGRVAVMDYDGNFIESYVTGVQPDMVTFSKDGRYILTADEGEPREGYTEGTEDPAGSVTIIDTKNDEVTIAGFGQFDSEELASQGILFSKINGVISSAAQDFEPEYIAVNSTGTKAYVSLQEANAIAVLDLNKKEFVSVKSLGFQNYGEEENAIDLVDDGEYNPAVYPDTYGVRMPDGISIYEAGNATYLLTANEGDAREWGDFINEVKATITSVEGEEAKKVRMLDQSVTAGLDSDKNYLFGSRSFSIFNADTMELIYDSGNDFEDKTASYLPKWFNCSNDDIEVDSRSQKKGPEPESITVGRIGNDYYAFTALERIGGVMVYNITSPSNAEYVNYINTRNFGIDVGEDVAPEGVAFVSSNYSGSGKPVLIAACEVSGTVAAYTMSGAATEVVTPEEAELQPEVPEEDSEQTPEDDSQNSKPESSKGDKMENTKTENNKTETVRTGDSAPVIPAAVLMALSALYLRLRMKQAKEER